MLPQRLTWAGGAIISALTVYLAWAQVAPGLARWSFCIIGILLFIASMVMFPWGQNDDGSPRRLLNYVVRGRNNPSFVAADDSTVTGPILVTGGSTVHQHGLTVEQIGELKKHVDDQVAGEVERYVDRRMEAFEKDVVKYTGQANQQALILGRQLITDFVAQLASRAPENINSLGTVDMQYAILNAQTSAAVADDGDLTETLVDILVDKSGAEPRSFKGVVLTEALQVAGKLTADQVNLLTALLMIRHTITHNLNTVDSVLDRIDSRCRPLYGKIPTSNSPLQYMAYTGVGDIERIGHRSIADTIVRTYDGIFTQGFTADQLPDELKPTIANLPQVDARIRIDPDRLRFPVASAQTLDVYKDTGVLNEPFLTNIDAMKPLFEANLLPGDKFLEVLNTEKPELAQFFRDLEQIGAQSFMLSAVGIALGQANWRRLLPDDAPDVDIYLKN